MTVLYTILGFVFILGLIIAIHEFGHYIFAKRAGILVREYAFGMGPQLLKKKKGETVYSLRAFPIGGFCAIAGEEFEGDPFANISRMKLRIENGVIKGFYLDVDNKEIKYPEYSIVGYDIYDKDETGNLYMDVDENGQVVRYKVDPQALIYYKKTELQIAPYNRTLGSKNKGKGDGDVRRALDEFSTGFSSFLHRRVDSGFSQYAETKVTFAGMDESNRRRLCSGLRSGDVIIELRAGSYMLKRRNGRYIGLYGSIHEAGLAPTIEATYLRDGVKTPSLSAEYHDV